jgi:hypothetical protein
MPCGLDNWRNVVVRAAGIAKIYLTGGNRGNGGREFQRWAQVDLLLEAQEFSQLRTPAISAISFETAWNLSITIFLRSLRFLLFKMSAEAFYVCGACGEEIVIPIDLSQGEQQEYIEDCPVCCRANLIFVEVDEDGEVRAWAELE